MSKFKTLTHVLAGGLVLLAGFFVSPAGIALVHQYPEITPVVGAIAVAALYYKPKAAN